MKGATVHATMNDATALAEDRRVQLVGGMVNFCDPATYPTAEQLSELPLELGVAIRYHPKHATRSSRRQASDLKAMDVILQDPRVIAIGELGLDHSVHD